MNRAFLNRCFLNAIALNGVGRSRKGHQSASYEVIDYVLLQDKAYFDTGLVLKDPTFSIEVDAQMMKPSNTSSPAMVCGFMGGNNNIPRVGIGAYTNKWLMSPNVTTSFGTFDEERHKFISETYATTSGYNYMSLIDGLANQTASLASSDTFKDNNLSIYIGARNNNGVAGNFIDCKVYGLVIWRLTTKLAEFVPAVRKKDGAVGFADLVSGKFITNAGGGSVTAGRDNVPAGYREIVGIHMNDDSYYSIDGFRLRGSDSINISFSAEKACNLFGCYTTANAQDNYSVYLSTSSAAKYLRYNGGTYLSEIVANQRYDLEITPTGCTGFAKESTWEQKDFEASVDMLIGSTSVGATSAKMIGDIYGHIEVVDRLILVPCEREKDGVIGYYDLVSGVFYAPTIGNPVSLGYKTQIISFSVEGYDKTFNAEEGMNWMEFCASAYNTEGWECYADANPIYLYDSGGWFPDTYYLNDPNSSRPVGGDFVKDGYAYTLDVEEGMTGGGWG